MIQNNHLSLYRHIRGDILRRFFLYHFAIFAIVNEILIIENRQKLVFNNFLLGYYQPYRKIARDKNCLLSSHRALRIFSKFFINFLVLNFLIGSHFCSTEFFVIRSLGGHILPRVCIWQWAGFIIVNNSTRAW